MRSRFTEEQMVMMFRDADRRPVTAMVKQLVSSQTIYGLAGHRACGTGMESGSRRRSANLLRTDRNQAMRIELKLRLTFEDVGRPIRAVKGMIWELAKQLGEARGP